MLTSIATFDSLNVTKKRSLVVSEANGEIKFHDEFEKEVKEEKFKKYYLATVGKDLDWLMENREDLVHELQVIARVNPK